jgi:hypothetical protein
MTQDVRNSPKFVEVLSAKFHEIYQEEARRQAGTGDDTVRHPDEYNDLPEHTKEYDRVLARYVLENIITPAWGVIANSGGGNWENESVEWQQAAARWRDSVFGGRDG